ncbi:jg27883 [Pararge aegeria aegeria]|uniref:Jg27883 protein n=1 Tax=Pararge aegeria aegeria TaxID=348720 RepID=A0A8S4QR35_9NEOP|nr:jg27883 [Pararge aegeria aegeria]
MAVGLYVSISGLVIRIGQAPAGLADDLMSSNAGLLACLGMGLYQEVSKPYGLKKRRDRRPEGASCETEPRAQAAKGFRTVISTHASEAVV